MPPVISKKRGAWVVYGTIALGIAVGVIGYWALLPNIQQQVGTATRMTPIAENSSSVSTETTQSLTTVSPSTQAQEPDAPQPAIPIQSDEMSEEPELSKAEILGYGWVLKTRCGSIPDVEWWKYKTHDVMANYVVRKKSGDWGAFVNGLVVRLAKLHDVAERNSSVVTTGGVTLKDEQLNIYIQQFTQRLAVARCLAAEARAAAEKG